MLVVIRGHGPDGRCDGPSLEECVLLLQKITEHHGGYTAVAAVIFLSLSGGIFGTAVKLGNQLQFFQFGSAVAFQGRLPESQKLGFAGIPLRSR